MKNYIFVLNDFSKKEPSSVLEQLKNLGAENLQFLSEIGVITSQFKNTPNLSALDGVISYEEEQQVYANKDS